MTTRFAVLLAAVQEQIRHGIPNPHNLGAAVSHRVRLRDEAVLRTRELVGEQLGTGERGLCPVFHAVGVLVRPLSQRRHADSSRGMLGNVPVRIPSDLETGLAANNSIYLSWPELAGNVVLVVGFPSVFCWGFVGVVAVAAALSAAVSRGDMEQTALAAFVRNVA